MKKMLQAALQRWEFPLRNRLPRRAGRFRRMPARRGLVQRADANRSPAGPSRRLGTSAAGTFPVGQTKRAGTMSGSARHAADDHPLESQEAMDAFFIGIFGAISVFQVLHVDRRQFACTCVGDGSNGPPGFVTVPETRMTTAMIVRMETTRLFLYFN